MRTFACRCENSVSSIQRARLHLCRLCWFRIRLLSLYICEFIMGTVPKSQTNWWEKKESREKAREKIKVNTERTRICEHRVRPAHSNNKMKLQIDDCMDHRHLSEHSMKNAISVSTTAPSLLRLLSTSEWATTTTTHRHNIFEFQNESVRATRGRRGRRRNEKNILT